MGNMQIDFNNVVPHPLKGMTFSSQSIWGQSVSIKSDSRYILYSESGKGKSTFIAYLMGIRNDFDGEVLLDGIPWSAISLDQKAMLRAEKMAFLHQDLKLFPKLTALENLHIKNDLRQAVSEQELEQLLDRFGLNAQKNQICGTLSKGQQQRVALIRALIQPFDFLVMDEPFSHLDEGNIAIGKELIDTYCTRNKAGFLIASLGANYGFSNHQPLYL